MTGAEIFELVNDSKFFSIKNTYGIAEVCVSCEGDALEIYCREIDQVISPPTSYIIFRDGVFLHSPEVAFDEMDRDDFDNEEEMLDYYGVERFDSVEKLRSAVNFWYDVIVYG